MSGVQAEFIDTQDVQLTNVSDGVTYDQLENVRISRKHVTSFHQLTSDEVDKNFSLTDIMIEGDIIATSSELALLKTLSTMVNAQLPIRNYTVLFTDQSGTPTSYNGDGFLSIFDPVDSGEGALTWHFVLEMRAMA